MRKLHFIYENVVENIQNDGNQSMKHVLTARVVVVVYNSCIKASIYSILFYAQ